MSSTETGPSLFTKFKNSSSTPYLKSSELRVLKAQTATAQQLQELAVLLGYSEESAR